MLTAQKDPERLSLASLQSLQRPGRPVRCTLQAQNDTERLVRVLVTLRKNAQRGSLACLQVLQNT